MIKSLEFDKDKKFVSYVKTEIKKEILFCEEISKRYTHSLFSEEISKRYAHRLHTLESCLREYEKALYHINKAKEYFMNTERR